MLAFVDIISGVVTDPRRSAEKILSLRLGYLIVLQAALFVAICSTILTYLFMQIIASRLTGTIDEPTLLISDLLSYISSVQPLYFTANQIFQMLVFSLIITVGGKLFNGKGKFFEALLCITMVEAVLIVLKVLQLALLPFSSVLAFMVVVPGLIWSLWAFATTAALIHGFKSTLVTFFGGVGLSILFFLSLNLFF